MTDAGLVVSWSMTAEDWQSIARVQRRAGVDQMVKFARGAKSRTPIRFATFYLRAGWTGLPPMSTAPAQPKHLRVLPDWCEDPDCDEITRMRQVEDDNDLRALIPCPACHPSRKDTAA
ncbi:hypothetical protein [Streptomyces sp. UH6]|uniref:hypothetical protein n=1 Tax=Streptomyces sp. UH6 TaxID=2748379 RepID=UPI0015D4AA51|nr:hypothetical protein [Streptomyces sp. UH6]NYV73119.1 hypothetical protein [Streptomyces sp. UH6]